MKKTFKEGDIIHSKYSPDSGQILVVKDPYRGEKKDLFFHFRCNEEGRVIILGDTIGTFRRRTDREATLQEKQTLLTSLQKSGNHSSLLSLLLGRLYLENIENRLE